MKQYPLSSDIFLFLAVGLARFLEEGKRYPYPSEFQKALHHLSFSLGDKYPKTITDLLHLFNTKREHFLTAKREEAELIFLTRRVPLSRRSALHVDTRDRVHTLLSRAWGWPVCFLRSRVLAPLRVNVSSHAP